MIKLRVNKEREERERVSPRRSNEFEREREGKKLRKEGYRLTQSWQQSRKQPWTKGPGRGRRRAGEDGEERRWTGREEVKRGPKRKDGSERRRFELN